MTKVATVWCRLLSCQRIRWEWGWRMLLTRGMVLWQLSLNAWAKGGLSWSKKLSDCRFEVRLWGLLIHMLARLLIHMLARLLVHGLARLLVGLVMPLLKR